MCEAHPGKREKRTCNRVRRKLDDAPDILTIHRPRLVCRSRNECPIALRTESRGESHCLFVGADSLEGVRTLAIMDSQAALVGSTFSTSQHLHHPSTI